MRNITSSEGCSGGRPASVGAGSAAIGDVRFLLAAQSTAPSTGPTIDPARATTQPATTQPGAGQGDMGALVPSTKGAGHFKHFVSPKKAEAIVTIEANNIPQGMQMPQDYEWRVNGNEQPGQAADPRKLDISRANVGRFEVVLWDVKKGAVDPAKGPVDTMVVWIVWADISMVTSAEPTSNKLNFNQAYPGSQGIPNRWKPAGAHVIATFKAKAIIQPATILDTTEDVPDLTGGPLTPPIPGNSSDGTPLSNGVNARWDMTRRTTVRATTTAQFVNFIPEDGPHNYPANPDAANDDSGVSGEDNNPYDNQDQGALVQEDLVIRPGAGIGLMDVGYSPATYQMKAWFQDFARLQLGAEGSAKWFRISDYLPWRVEFNMKKLDLKESNWQEDSDQQNGIEPNRIMLEQDPGFAQVPPLDFNHDGVINGNLSYWDQDPGKGSFLQPDNVGLPQ